MAHHAKPYMLIKNPHNIEDIKQIKEGAGVLLKQDNKWGDTNKNDHNWLEIAKEIAASK